jgi:hypothetical protein
MNKIKSDIFKFLSTMGEPDFDVVITVGRFNCFGIVDGDIICYIWKGDLEYQYNLNDLEDLEVVEIWTALLVCYRSY